MPASGAIFTLEDFYHRLPIRQDVRAILPVVDGGRYTAMVTANDRHDIPRQDWSTHTVMDIAHPDWRTGEPDETLRDALRIMESAAVTAMAVVGPDASYLGMISTAEILRLDEVLDLDD